MLFCMRKCEWIRPVEASVHAPALLHGHPPHWLTEFGHQAITCHLNLLHLLWWCLTQRCPCHYCRKRTEVKNGQPKVKENIYLAVSPLIFLHDFVPHLARKTSICKIMQMLLDEEHEKSKNPSDIGVSALSSVGSPVGGLTVHWLFVRRM